MSPETWTAEDRERVLTLFAGMEKTRLSREAAGRDDEVCPEWEKMGWPEVFAALMTGIALGWVERFEVYVNTGEGRCKPSLDYLLTSSGSRAVDARIRRDGRP